MNESKIINNLKAKIDDNINLSKHKEKDDNNLNKLYIVSFVCLCFMIVEVIGGYIANSIAIMSDAAHMFSDLLGFIISIISIHIAKKQATNQMSYGYHRAEVIGALASVTIIWGLTLWLIYEASMRMINPSPVGGGTMLIVAILGLLFNVCMGLILAYEGIDHAMHAHHDHDHDHGHDNQFHSHNHNDHKHDNVHIDIDKNTLNCEHKEISEPLLVDNIEIIKMTPTVSKKSIKHHTHLHNEKNINIRAAIIHIIGDTVQNIGVIIAGALIYYNPSWRIIDPICTFFFAIIVFMTTIRILKDCVEVIMEGSPIDHVNKMEEDLLVIEGVTEVHDLHVWSLSMGKMIMTCHLISTTPQESLMKACAMIKEKYRIDHSTIQVEEEKDDMSDCKQTLH